MSGSHCRSDTILKCALLHYDWLNSESNLLIVMHYTCVQPLAAKECQHDFDLHVGAFRLVEKHLIVVFPILKQPPDVASL